MKFEESVKPLLDRLRRETEQAKLARIANDLREQAHQAQKELEQAHQARKELEQAHQARKELEQAITERVEISAKGQKELERIAQIPTKRQKKLHKPPFYGARCIFSFLFTRKAYESINQTISDCETEYYEALNEGKIGKSRWTKLIGWLILTKTVLAQLGVSMGDLMIKIWKISR